MWKDSERGEGEWGKVCRCVLVFVYVCRNIWVPPETRVWCLKMRRYKGRKYRQREREGDRTEIAAAHYHHLYLSGCRTSNYSCHTAPNMMRGGAMRGVCVFCQCDILVCSRHRISFTTFLPQSSLAQVLTSTGLCVWLPFNHNYCFAHWNNNINRWLLGHSYPNTWEPSRRGSVTHCLASWSPCFHRWSHPARTSRMSFPPWPYCQNNPTQFLLWEPRTRSCRQRH